MAATKFSSHFQVSENVAQMKASSTLAAMQVAEAMRAAGVDVVDLGAGEPDFDTPQNIKDAAAEAMRAGQTKYTPTGGKQAIFNAVVSLINPDDEVLLPKPYWVTFPEIVAFARGRSVFIETEENDFTLTAEMVRKAITP